MAGLQILMKGGNAIDAAVAVGAALNMMEPQMNGIGGNGFMTVYDKKSGQVYSLAMAGADAEGAKAGGHDAGDAELGHQRRHRAGQSWRLCHGAASDSGR